MAKPKHYKLFNDILIRLNLELKANELIVYLYLASKHPFEDSKMEIDTSLISEHLGLHRRTVQLAIKKLVSLDLIEIDLVRFKYRIAKHGHNSQATSYCSKDEIRESEDRQSDHMIATNESEDRHQGSDLALGNGSGVQQTLQTIKTNKTLSDPEEEKTAVDSEEREKKKLTSSENKILVEDRERSHSDLPKEIVNDSASLKNAEQPRLKPKNLSSKNKGFAPPTSTNVWKRAKQLVDLYGLKRTVVELGRTELPPDQYEPFLQFARKRIDGLKVKPSSPDLLVVAHLDSYVADFNYQRNKQVTAEKTIEQKRAKDNRSRSLNDRLALAFEQAYEENLATRGLTRQEVPGIDLEEFKSQVWKNSQIRRDIINGSK